MSDKVTVWTKQQVAVLQDIEEANRYIVKKEYIQQKMEEYSDLYLEAYGWYFQAASKIITPPKDVRYPIWVSLSQEEAINNSEGNIILEIEIEKNLLLIVDLLKWGNIVNYLYIPKDLTDQKEHDQLLKIYGIDDCTAYMTPFYPNIKQKIQKSRERLFDDSSVSGEEKVGTIWEIRKEWITKIMR
ncbi:DUF3841 domain-containing protein [Enterococcus hermanniensis]|uniref:DUF3841 domain-containing protein n=1 Tax=Enterococcus hermanniensis TaxID=249189 RepID=A0A1L8TLL6_9ENTE|nr:DUF3841 domain-containing protein [Enterococcus hermanniensis]OJG45239.1 hypothetical protein RV04_GL002287 [Enterococcus hermanniensis]